MKKYLFLCLAAVAFIACSNDVYNIFPTNQKVVESLLTQYPSAQNVTWGRAWGYWVAEFDRAEDEIMVECEAWFSNDGVWYLGVSNIPYTSLPIAVQNSFSTSQYGQWFIDEVDMIERYNSEVVYAIEAETDNINTADDVVLHYTPDGILIRSILNGSEPDYRPIILGEQITNYISTNYPAATTIDIAAATDINEVDIMDTLDLANDYVNLEWDEFKEKNILLT